MASLNKVMVIGNLTQDPELRRIPSGTAVSTLRVAVDESFQTRGGDRVERTVYLDVDVWDRQAENCVKYLQKGSPVFVEGRLQLDTWDDKETGQKRSRLKVRGDRVQFLSGGPRSEGGAAGSRPAARPPEKDYEEPLSSGDGGDEDIPF